METQSNNLIPELADFRAELATFKQRLNDQQIINDRLLRRSMKARISPFIMTGVVGDATALLITPFMFVAFNRLGIHWTLGAGFVILFMALVMGIQTLVRYFRGSSVEGFTTVILLILLIGSTIMISLGIIGYYIARIYEEIKGRPRYIIEEFLG